MLRFVLKPNAFREIRNKLLTWLTLVYLLMVGGLYWMFSGVDQNETAYIMFAIILVVFIFSGINTLRRQKKIYESFALTVDSEGFLREQFNTPSLRILNSDITSIVRVPNGTLSIVGSSRLNPIIIPAQIDERDNLEVLLNAIKPIEQRTSNKRNTLFILGSIVIFFGSGGLFFRAENKIVAGISGSLLLLFLIVSLIIIFRSKNIEKRVRRSSLFGIVPVLSLSVMLYVKVFSTDVVEIPMRSSFFESSFTVYFLDENQAMSRDEFSQFITQQLPAFQLVDSIPVTIDNDIFYINAPENIREDYVPGTPEYLEHAGVGLSSEEVTKLQTVEKGIYVSFFGPPDSLQQKHIGIASFLDALGKQKNVIILDENARLYFNTTSWKHARIAELQPAPLNIPSQINIHVYREDEFCRAVTLGMDKFALPDISIKNFPCSDQEVIGKLINLLAQTMSENPVITRDSLITVDVSKIENDSMRFYLTVSDVSNQNATIKLKSVYPEEGDAFTTQVTIDFGYKESGSLQEEQRRLLTKLFGSEDSIVFTKHDDALLQASAKARERLPELRVMFTRRLDVGYSIAVKAPFLTDDGENREWMWVEVTGWDNKHIKGILQSEPFNVSGLVAGAEVEVNEDDIFDYILYKPDGSYEGNETQKYLD